MKITKKTAGLSRWQKRPTKRQTNLLPTVRAGKATEIIATMERAERRFNAMNFDEIVEAALCYLIPRKGGKRTAKKIKKPSFYGFAQLLSNRPTPKRRTVSTLPPEPVEPPPQLELF